MELAVLVAILAIFTIVVATAFLMGKKIEKNVCSGDCNCPLCPVKMELKSRGAI